MPDDQPGAAYSNSVLRVVAASFIGTTIEWYDFFIYGTAAALVLGKQFFPDASPVAGSLAAFATPDAVYLSQSTAGSFVTFVYAPRADLPPTSVEGVGLLLTQFRGELAPEFVGKMLGPGTTVTELRVGTGRALWIAGAPHVLLYRDAQGNVRDDTLRLAGNTLLWERDGVLLRIESALSQDQAVRIAESVR